MTKVRLETNYGTFVGYVEIEVSVVSPPYVIIIDNVTYRYDRGLGTMEYIYRECVAIMTDGPITES